MLESLVRFCVQRRLLVVVVTAAVAAYGFTAYRRTPVEAFPDVTNLQVNVVAQLPGLAPPEIERQVTVPLERALNGTPHLLRMRSESLFGLSLVYLTFEDGADPFEARTRVSERIATAELPDGVVPELGPEATPLGQIFQYHVVSDRHDLHAIRSEQEWVIGPYLRRTPGVADVVTRGGFLREVHVEVDPARMRRFDLDLEDVSEAVERASRNVGGGMLPVGEQQLVIRSVGAFSELSEVRSVLVAEVSGTPVRLSDVATVLLSHTPRQGAVGHDHDRDVVEGVVYLRRGENPSVVLDGIHQRVDELNDGMLPEGMHLVPFYDRSRLVDLTLSTVHHSLLEGALLVIGLVWLFIRSFKASLVVGIVIPLSVLVAFIGLDLVGLPANLISMGAIDFGILVDGAVILAENVVHHLRHGPHRSEADVERVITKAGVEVARPTLFAMAIIIAALVPVFSLESVEGRIFRPLALTYTFALIGALIFALTTVPALATYALKRGGVGAEPQWIESIRRGYERVLGVLLRVPQLAIAIVVLLLGGAALAAPQLGSEFLPDLDEGDLLVFVELPTSTSLSNGQDILAALRERVLTVPEVSEVETQQGRPEDGTDNESVNMAEMPIRLRPRSEWREGMTTEGLIEEVRALLDEVPGVRFTFSQPMRDNVEEAMSGVRGKVVLKIYGEDLEVMRATLMQALEVLGDIDGIVDLSLYRDRSVPQLEIHPDRDALARAGVDIAAFQATVETALGGRVLGEVWENGRSVPIRLRMARAERSDPSHVADLPIAIEGGSFLPLSAIAEVGVTPGRASINRENGVRSLALKFNVEGRDLGSVISEAMAAVHEHVPAPEGHYMVWAGEFENQARAVERLSVVVPISLLLVLALLFGALGSIRPAASVLVVAPIAATGGVFTLLFSGVHLSVSAAIGFIALLGQVSLAALLVLGAIETRRAAGMPTVRAIREGASERFRAVVLTALLAMLGLMPMATSSGVGSETQRPFALVLIGGLATTLVVVLFVLPVLYAFVAGGNGGQPEGDPPTDASAKDESAKGEASKDGAGAIAGAVLLALAALSAPSIAHAQALPERITLDEAIERAQRSPTVHVAEARAAVARAGTHHAGDYENLRFGWQGWFTIDGFNDAWNGYQHTFEIGIPLAIGDPMSARSRAADLEADAAEARVGVTRHEVARAVAEAFFAALAAATEAEEIQRTVEALEALLAIVNARAGAGDRSRYDVLRVELEVARARADQLAATTRATSAARALGALLGEPGWAPIPRASLETSLVGEGSDDASVDRLPAHVAAERAVEARRADVERERREAIPIPTLGLGYGFATDAYASALMVSLDIPLPVFDQNGRAIDVAIAEAAAGEDELSAIDTLARARLSRARADVEQLRADLSRFDAEVLERSAPLRAMTEAAYRAGAGSVLELVDAARTAQGIALDRVARLSALRAAELELLDARGELLR